LKRILFIDDEPLVLQGLKSTLYRRRKDWDLSFAEGGAAGVELMRQEPFDAIVTDLRMPGVDGLAVLKEARLRLPAALRLVFSGSTDERQTVRLISIAQQYLSKPCEPGRLEALIERCFATQSLIESESVRARLGGAKALPAVPATFAKLQAVLADERCDMKAVARVIETDPAIVAKLLQVVNSAFFRLPRRVSSVEQAVTHLGTCAIRDLTLAAEMFQSGPSLPKGIDPIELQRHAFRVAAVARRVGQGKQIADDCFLAGLIHDIGLLLLGNEFPDEMTRVIEAIARGEQAGAAELRIAGIEHGVAGAYLLGNWGLPYDVIEAVAHHHAPERIAQDSLDVLAAVSIALALVAQIDGDDTPAIERTVTYVGPDYLKKVGVEADWDELIERANATLAEER